jgi:hypothetical protein
MWSGLTEHKLIMRILGLSVAILGQIHTRNKNHPATRPAIIKNKTKDTE